jgi:hypothetical protein
MLVEHLNTFNKLLQASSDNLASVHIENPNLFLKFCNENKLDAFLYSLYLSQQQFAQSFPQAEVYRYRIEYKKAWASNLRHDTIREQLNKAFIEQSYVFLDTSLASRFQYGNRLLRSDNVITVLIPKPLDMLCAINSIQALGFRKVDLSNSIAAKLTRTSDKNSSCYFFKRNQFLVSLNRYLPVSGSNQLDHQMIMANKVEMLHAESSFSILSQKDEIIFNLLSLYDALVYKQNFTLEFINVSIALSKVKNISEACESTNMNLAELVNFVDERLRTSSKIYNLKPPLSILNKIRLTKIINKKLDFASLLKIIFKTRRY